MSHSSTGGRSGGPLADLLAILDLEEIERNLFRAVSPEDGMRRVFGGQVVAQALAAACRTVSGRMVHSMHCYFLRGGDPARPILYEVDRIRDGGSFTTRRVVAIQNGEAIYTMAASFQVEEPGIDHQAPMPDVPAPEVLPARGLIDPAALDRSPEALRRLLFRERAFELRLAGGPSPMATEKRLPVERFWLRTPERLADDPVLHAILLAYVSDYGLIGSAFYPHGLRLFDPAIQAASLDHAVWFHRPFRIDDWLLYDFESPSAHAARGFAVGRFFDRAGRLVASTAQEGLIRRRDPARSDPTA